MKFVYAVVALCLVLYLAVESDALGSDAQSHNNERRMRQCLNKYTERIQILVESVHHDLQECGHCLLESRACKPKGECGEVLHDRHDDH
uniref:Truncated form of vanadium binding protein n=1 Tax=Ascidia sydneiensis samea TaxID=79730 RepID=B1B531_ASCSS|nr:truncated form of vanadium binding protein [Ascidia sydneiensis samea]